jgi:hypothetical protein
MNGNFIGDMKTNCIGIALCCYIISGYLVVSVEEFQKWIYKNAIFWGEGYGV